MTQAGITRVRSGPHGLPSAVTSSLALPSYIVRMRARTTFSGRDKKLMANRSGHPYSSGHPSLNCSLVQ
jgi:hypothetical protein